MAITFVGAGAAIGGNSASSSIALAAPTCQAGNLLIAPIVIHDTSATITPPSGWTQVNTAAATSPNVVWFSRVAVAADSGASFTFASTGTARIAGVILAYQNASGVNAKASSAAATTTSPITAPTVTTAYANQIVLEAFGLSMASSSSSSLSALPATVRASVTSSTIASGVPFGVSEQAQAAAGVSAAQSASFSGGGVGGVAATTIAIFGNQAPNAPTLTSPANNATIDRGIVQRFAWTFSDPDAGDSQSKFDLQYRMVNTTPWTTVSGTTPNTFYDFAASTFAAGNYEWQVRTYDSTGTQGPWSSSSFFTAANLHYYNGTSWAPCTKKSYNGTAWATGIEKAL